MGLLKKSWIRKLNRHTARVLKAHRKTSGMSQNRLSESSGITRSLIIAIESGDSGNVTLATIHMLCEAMGTDVGDFCMFKRAKFSLDRKTSNDR